MTRPQRLLCLRRSLEYHGVVQITLLRILHLSIENSLKVWLNASKSYLTVWMQLSQVHRVNEGDVVGGVPVEAVAIHVEWNTVYQAIDGGNNLR